MLRLCATLLLLVGAVCASITCRYCGMQIASGPDLRRVHSEHAVEIVERSVLGHLWPVVSFLDPHGRNIDIVAVANGDIRAQQYDDEETWFPGYSWSYAYCPECGQLLGWHFRKLSDPDEGFCMVAGTDCPDEFTALKTDAVLFGGETVGGGRRKRRVF
eukprot:m.771176 g.771176  ORF g.771176 m.771176 type:complete len:159 (-) comp59089_c0_seq2:63-539(-)